MNRSTIFNFTLPTGESESVFFERDYVDEGKITVGTCVQVIPSGDTFKMLVGPLPGEQLGVPCRVMALVEAQVNLGSEKARPFRDVWILHLAAEGASVRYH